MTRPLRIEFPGALYHVTARGDRSKPIFIDDRDRYEWLSTIGLVCTRYNSVVHSFCQMSNHYHLMLETVEGNLSHAMGCLNSRYSQYFNRRHSLAGHVLQGRYHAILVQKESYLLECARYVVLNPVRAGIVTSPEQWPWSSHNYMAAGMFSPHWLNITWLLAQFGSDNAAAIQGYQQFVREGIGKESPFKETKHRMVLGDEAFTRGHGDRLFMADLKSVIKDQRRLSAKDLSAYQAHYPCRDEAMAQAYHSTAFTMSEIGKHFGVSYKTVSRAVKLNETATPPPTSRSGK